MPKAGEEMKISLMITVYNEESIIQDTINKVISYMDGLLGYQYELILINDGSTDNTEKIIAEAVKRHHGKIIQVDHPYNMGRGQGMRTGFEKATGDYVITLDADLSYSPRHIEKLINALTSQSADIVCASPYMKGGVVENVPASRLLYSKLGNWLLSLVHPVKLSTYTSIVRGYRREALERLELSSRGKEIHIEILDKAYYLGLSICEIPASLIWHKEHGKGGAAERKPKFNLFKIIYSHIVLAIFARPGIIFAFPGVALFSIGAYLTALFAHSFLKLFFGFHQQFTFNTALSMASREFYSQSQYSFMFASFCLILGIQFFIMYFLAIQNKKYFEENFRMLSRINSQLKVKK